jgi:hypothetical protein
MSEWGLTPGDTTADEAGSIGLLESSRILIADVIDTLTPPNRAPLHTTFRVTLVSHDLRTHCQGSRFVFATVLAPGITQVPA